MKGALITGGAGFVGSHLAEKLVKMGAQVVVVDNLASGQEKNLTAFRDKIHFVKADVCQDWKSWTAQVPEKFLANIERVFHLASLASPPHYQEQPLETMWVNSLGLSRALEFADQRKAHLTFSSTSEIYGDPEVHPQIESYRGNVNTYGPRSCYDESKRFGESLIYSWNQVHKTHHGCVRIFNTYGPRMNLNDGRVVINFLQQASLGQELTIYGTGEQTRSFCFVSDLCEAIYRYSKLEKDFPINIGNDTELTINGLVETTKKLYPGKALKVTYSPLPKDDPTQRRPNLQLAKEHLQGWAPSISLEQGLREMKRWIETELSP